MPTKKCCECGQSKPIDQFGKNSSRWKGIQSSCKECTVAYRKKYRSLNRGRLANKQREYRRRNRGAYIQQVKERKQYMSEKATPSWAKRHLIEAYYMIAKGVTEQTGIPHVVDHIIPLKGENVCGLHVENNLQVMTSAANNSKGNKMVDALQGVS